MSRTQHETVDLAVNANSNSSPVDPNILKLSRKSSLESVGVVKNQYKEKYHKLSQAIKVLYLSIKRRLVKEDSDCIPELKDIIPLHEDDDLVVRKDSIVLSQYIKKIYEKSLENRIEQKKQLAENGEKEMSQYEPHLIKLEAEVRKHIQIEQQMKILIDNQQERITELEKSGGVKSSDTVEKEKKALQSQMTKVLTDKQKIMDVLNQENVALKNQLKESQSELLKLKSMFASISQIVKSVENPNFAS